MLENDYFSIIHNYVHNVYNYARLAKIDAVRAYMSKNKILTESDEFLSDRLWRPKIRQSSI